MTTFNQSSLNETGAREIALVIDAPADMVSCDYLRQFLTRCHRAISEGAESLTLDLTQVNQADSKLMACLIVVYQQTRQASIDLHLKLSPAVHNIVEVCRLGWFIERIGHTE